ncbi:MAG: metallophosphatase [Proteobacteria bacterium]|nr:metallophosphatase [Pseudomonadota bacterium]
MDRRQFLKLGSFIGVSTATLGLAGCIDSNDDGNAGATFPQGVASGDPKPDSIMLWCRAVPKDGATTTQLRLQLSEQENFSSLLVDTELSADRQWDYTLRHKVDGLQAATTYYYRFIAGPDHSPSGRTKTAAAAGSALGQLKFAFITCQDWSVNHWGAMEELLNEDLDFIIHLGDYIYETVGATFQSSAAESRHAQLVLPDGMTLDDGSKAAASLADYRYLYQTYRSDSRLQALHQRFPVIAIWDDHEFSDDCWQNFQTYALSDNATPVTARRRFANQAWFEYMPADITFSSTDSSFTNIKIYRSFTFGNLATLVMTDQRLYRADHIIPESAAGSEIGSRYFVSQGSLAGLEAQKIAAAGGQLTPVSMLGDTQRSWWQEQMRTANTTWKLWGNEVSLLRMLIDGNQAVAGLLAASLVSANGGLLPLQSAMTAALVLDMKAANKTASLATSSFSNLAALLASQAGISAAVFAAGIKPALDAALPISALLDVIIIDADQWDGYNAERKALMSYLRSNAISNVVALTGDLHAFFAGLVMDDYDAASPVPVMVDIVTAGISSNSLFSYYKSMVDTNAAFASAKPLVYSTVNGEVVNTFNTTLASFNGNWINHLDTDAQGYAVVTLTASQFTCVLHKVKPLGGATTAPAQPATASSKTITVNAGSPNLSVA